MIDVVNNELVTTHEDEDHVTVIQNVELVEFEGRTYELIFGSDANDVLTTDGSSLSEFYVLVGGDGQDTLTGGLRGDAIKGGGGDDLINGLLGRDRLFGNDGDDVIYGRGGGDNLFGNDGRDTLFGGAKNDVLFGGRGSDSLIGGQGNDNLLASLGHDTLEGNQGEDTLIGWDGNDLLIGGNGADRLEAGSGQDTLIGGNGCDFFVLGAGPDTLIFDLSDGRNYVSSFRLGHDQIQFGGFEGLPDLSHLTFEDLEFRQRGSDTILNIGDTRIEFRDRDVEDIAISDHFLFL
jgi:Ca2+-binding RTX toxin-like protein